MTIQQMTKIQAHFEESNLELNLNKDADGHYLDEVARYAWMNWMTAYSFGREHQANLANKAIEIALAEQQGNEGSAWYTPTSFIDKQKLRESQQESEYITAAQARELGVENAEYKYSKNNAPWTNWITCFYGCGYEESDNSWKVKYRAIKQAPPEPVDKHAALRVEYAKQVRDDTRHFYLWQHKVPKLPLINCFGAPEFHPEYEYHCTDISCYVSKDGDTAIRMLRTEAQALQRKLGGTADWHYPTAIKAGSWNLDFDGKGTYTYRTKATIKLDGNMVTPEQAAAEWKAKRETHDVWFTTPTGAWVNVGGDFDSDSSRGRYELRPKQPTWTGSREDVIALLKEMGLL